IENRFDVQSLRPSSLILRRWRSRQDEVILPITQFRVVTRGGSQFVKAQDRAWISLGKELNDMRDDRECDRQRGCYLHFSRRRITEGLDVADALRHAALLDDREKHMQVAQPQAPPDLTLPVDFSQHRKVLISIKTDREFPYNHKPVHGAIKVR